MAACSGVLARWLDLLFSSSATSSTTRCPLPTRMSRSSGARSSCRFWTTVLCLIFGFPTAYFIATRSEKWRDVWLFLITIPFWTNLLIRTFAIQEVIRNEGMVNSLLMWLGIIDQPLQIMFTDFAIMLGMVYVYLPLMVLPLYASLEKLDFRLVEAGYDLYANALQGAAADHPAAGQARHHRRFDPGLHSRRSAPM